jgi:hypothetical protein
VNTYSLEITPNAFLKVNFWLLMGGWVASLTFF